jgi:hypothetical protein
MVRSTKSAVVSWDDAVAENRGKWLIFEVFSERRGWPETGVVLDSAASSDEAFTCLGGIEKRKIDPKHNVFVLEAVDYIDNGEDARRAIQQAIDEEREVRAASWPR